jgi:hypothetical protein
VDPTISRTYYINEEERGYRSPTKPNKNQEKQEANKT